MCFYASVEVCISSICWLLPTPALVMRFIYLFGCMPHITIFFFFSWQFEEIYYPSVHSLDECCIVSNGKSFSVIQGILPSLIFSNQFKRFMFRLGWNTEAYDFWSNHKNTNTCIFSSVSMQYFLVTEEMRTLRET